MEEAESDVCFQKISEASPSGLKSDSAVLCFGGLGRMNELLCQFPLPYTKKTVLSALLGCCELQNPTWCES